MKVNDEVINSTFTVPEESKSNNNIALHACCWVLLTKSRKWKCEIENEESWEAYNKMVDVILLLREKMEEEDEEWRVKKKMKSLEFRWEFG